MASLVRQRTGDGVLGIAPSNGYRSLMRKGISKGRDEACTHGREQTRRPNIPGRVRADHDQAPCSWEKRHEATGPMDRHQHALVSSIDSGAKSEKIHLTSGQGHWRGQALPACVLSRPMGQFSNAPLCPPMEPCSAAQEISMICWGIDCSAVCPS